MPAAADGQPYVFISYASADRERVLSLVARLEAAGVRFWIDRDGIQGGANYGVEIAEAIKHASAIAVFASEASFASRNVRQEIALAWRFERPYLPLMLEELSVPDDLAYWLEATQWIDLSNPSEPLQITRIAEALQRFGIECHPEPFPAGLRHRRQISRAIGRERELRLLAEKTELARSGHGGIVLVGGEAGIGKTTLIDETAQHAEEHGFAVLEGHCFDLVETPAYGPWIDLFLHLPPIGSVPLPEAFSLPGAVRRAPSQLAVFAQVERFLVAVSARQPVVTVLEDMHWSDPASLDLVRYLAASITSLPILVLVTNRSDELSRTHPLRALQSYLLRDPNVDRIELGPLSATAVKQLVTERYAMPEVETERLGAYVHGRTEGNALFVAELLRALEETGEIVRDGDGWSLGQLGERAVPSLLRQVIDGRIQRFDQASQRLLSVAAVIGQTVPIDVWLQVGGVDEEVLLNLSEEAETAQVLSSSADGRDVRFGHALIRDALYERIPAVRRRRLHQRTGEVLELIAARNIDAFSGELGNHFQRAGIAERAIPYLIRAGEVAQESHSHTTAIAYFQRVLALCHDHVANQPLDKLQELEAQACEGLGASLIWTGESASGRSVLNRGLERAGSALQRSRLLLLIGRAWFADGDEAKGQQFYDQAESELGPEPNSDEAGWWYARIEIFLQRLVNLYFANASVARGQQLLLLVDRYRDLVEQHGTTEQRVRFLHRSHLARIRQDRYAVSNAVVENIRKAARMAEQLDDTTIRCELTFSAGFADLWYGELDSAQKHFLQSLDLAERTGNLFERMLIFTYLTVIARMRGEVDLAEQLAHQALQAARLVDGSPQYQAAAQATLAWVAWRRGLLREANELGREACSIWEQHTYPFTWLGIWPLAAIALERGDISGAVENAVRLLDPTQQRLPEDLSRLVEEASAALDADDVANATELLNRALLRATELGYI